MDHVLKTFLEIKESGFANDPTVIAIKSAGIRKFREDFLSLAEEDLKLLQEKIGVIPTRKLIMVLAMFHILSRKVKGAIDIMSISKAQFDQFRIQQYDHTKPIVPWNVDDDPEDKERAAWKKSMKPNKTAFKDFKDAAFWIQAKENFEEELSSQGLSHLIDITHTPANVRLDEDQRAWLFTVFKERIKTPMGRGIVLKYKDTKDTRQIWHDLEEEFATSMTAEITASKLSTYLTSTILEEIGWRGTQESFIAHFKEQCRRYNLISDEAYTDKQQVRFLAQCVSRTTNLALVLDTHRAGQRGAGNKQDPTFEEYCALLAQAAQKFDAANIRRRNPRLQRSVNEHDLQFDDYDVQDFDQEEPGTDSYDVNVHDMDTPIEALMANQGETRQQSRPFGNTPQGQQRPGQRPGQQRPGQRPGQRPFVPGQRRVSLNRDTWNAMSKTEQESWDNITEDTKKAILEYGFTRKQNLNNVANNRRLTNQHEVICEDDPVGGVSNASLQVSTHQLVPRDEGQLKAAVTKEQLEAALTKAVPKPEVPDLLDMATGRSTKQDTPNQYGVDINHVLSQPSKNQSRQVSRHEIFTRSDYTPEAYVHEIDFSTIRMDADESEAEDHGDGESYQDEGQEEEDLIKFDDDPMYSTPQGLLDFSNITLDESFSVYEADASLPLNSARTDIGVQDDVPSPPQVEYMSGKFKDVEKPIPFKQRISPKKDGTGYQLARALEQTEFRALQEQTNPGPQVMNEPGPSLPVIQQALLGQQVDYSQGYLQGHVGGVLPPDLPELEYIPELDPDQLQDPYWDGVEDPEFADLPPLIAREQQDSSSDEESVQDRREYTRPPSDTNSLVQSLQSVDLDERVKAVKEYEESLAQGGDFVTPSKAARKLKKKKQRANRRRNRKLNNNEGSKNACQSFCQALSPSSYAKVPSSSSGSSPTSSSAEESKSTKEPDESVDDSKKIAASEPNHFAVLPTPREDDKQDFGKAKHD